MKRQYGQHCALAKALDVLGGRWTMLIIRDLIPGPRRYKDLLDNLPGIGSGLLTERLRALEQEGLVERRTLDPPAGSTVYQLTSVGRELEPALFGLARWGYSRLGVNPEGEDLFSPRWAMLTMRAVHNNDAARGLHETYEFRIDDDIFHVKIRDGDVDLFDGPGDDPDLIVETGGEAFLTATADPAKFEKALTSGTIVAEGTPDAQRHCVEIFAPAVAVAER